VSKLSTSFYSFTALDAEGAGMATGNSHRQVIKKAIEKSPMRDFCMSHQGRFDIRPNPLAIRLQYATSTG
jgi:hypothetical protein